MLCFIDEDVNIGKGYDISGGQGHPWDEWVNEAFNRRGNEDELKLAKTCAKIFYLQNDATPAAGAKAYFSAALAASYSKMILTDVPGSKMATYDTVEMQQKYKNIGDDLTKYAPDTCFVKAHGAHWFFCKLD